MSDVRWVGAVVACSLLLGCSAETSRDEPEVAVVSAALSVCEEMVPSDRNIDGIPAYAQCAASENSEIYSNNGVDTSSTQLGPDWVRTQRSGGYQCTELAHRYLVFRWDIDWVPRGNAGSWCDTVPPESIGIVQTMTPVHGDIMVLAPGSCGASASTGHATVVDVVDASGRLTVVEQNRARRGTYQTSCAKCFLHVVENDGTPGAAAGSGAPAGAGGTPAGTGGASGAMSQAGTMAPTPTTPPAMMPPAMMPPAMTPPAMTPPAVPAAPTMPVAGTGLSTAGAAATPPPDVAPRPSASGTAGDMGCSIARTGAPGHGGSSHAIVLLALALLALRPRRFTF
jgi:hypothetical protein